MAIQDSDPERRNLSVASIAFILFYFGGGELADNLVKLPIVNIRFTNTHFLAVAAWVALFWFLYRYWQKHRGKLRYEFSARYRSYYEKDYFRKYAEKKSGESFAKFGDTEGLRITGMINRDGALKLRYQRYTDIQWDKNSRKLESATGESKSTEIPVNGWMGFAVRFRALIECAYEEPPFSNYGVPYILFGFALVGALLSRVGVL